MRQQQQEKRTRPTAVHKWSVEFASRVRLAYDLRCAREPGTTQNKVAAEAGIDSGNFSRILAGTKANVLASAIVPLARALRCEPLWLLSGQEPSGLDRSAPRQHHVDVQVSEEVRALPPPARDKVRQAPARHKR